MKAVFPASYQREGAPHFERRSIRPPAPSNSDGAASTIIGAEKLEPDTGWNRGLVGVLSPEMGVIVAY